MLERILVVGDEAAVLAVEAVGLPLERVEAPACGACPFSFMRPPRRARRRSPSTALRSRLEALLDAAAS